MAFFYKKKPSIFSKSRGFFIVADKRKRKILFFGERKMKKEKKEIPVSVENIYQLEGRVPLGRAIPYGLQHILAMFVANLAPIAIIGAASGLTSAELSMLLQNAMFIAGIGTLIQLYGIWKIGSHLPVVMGVSFTFVAILSYVGINYGYPAVIGAVIVGGDF